MNKPEWPKLVDIEENREGFLTDDEIKRALGKGQLITEGDAGQAKYACYELRIGSDVRQLVLDRDIGGRNDLYRIKEIGEDGTFHIHPGETFKITASEKVYMPSDVFAIAIPVGNLYRLGLNPETTFADPGFARDFFVTVCNYSPRVVKLKVGDPLSRVFFFKLLHRPERIHAGDPREIPPAVERVRKPDTTDLQKKGYGALLDDVLRDVDPPHYQHAFVTSLVLELRKKLAATTLLAAAALLIVLFVGILYVGSILRVWWPALFDNLAASIVWTLALNVGIWFIPPFRRALVDAMGTLASKGPQ